MILTIIACMHHILSITNYTHKNIFFIFYKNISTHDSSYPLLHYDEEIFEKKVTIDSIIPANNNKYICLNDNSICFSPDYLSQIRIRQEKTNCDGFLIMIPYISYKYYMMNHSSICNSKNVSICTYHNNRILLPHYDVIIQNIEEKTDA